MGRNRTIVGLKQMCEIVGDEDTYSRNRTIVGLKLGAILVRVLKEVQSQSHHSGIETL